MTTPALSVRELTEADIPHIISYWLTAEKDYLVGMGVDVAKMPSKAEWESMLGLQLTQSYREKGSYGIIWLLDDRPVGHSNVNKIIFGEEAYMHLHIWDAEVRRHGYGNRFVQMTIPWFFRNLELKRLYCEPYALNPAPNRTMEKLGFRFVSEYITVPGWLNFEQPVRLWELLREEVPGL